MAAPRGRASQFGEARKRSAVILFLDPKALHPVAKLTKGDAQQLGGGGAVEPGLAQRLEDRLALERIEVVGQRLRAPRGRRRRFALDRRRRRQAQVFDLDPLGAGERQRALEDVLELADV